MSDCLNFELLNALPDGACIIDSEYRILFWNKKLEQWAQKKESEFTGYVLTDVFPHLADIKYKSRIDHVLKQGTPVFFSVLLHHHIFEFSCSDGSPQAQRVTVSPLVGKNGEMNALFTIVDMTRSVLRESKYKQMLGAYKKELQMRELLEKENQKLVTAVDKAAEAFIIMDTAGKIEYINTAFTEQTGWSRQDIQQQPSYWCYQKPEHDKTIDEYIKMMLLSGETWQGRRHIINKDGSTFIASVSIAPILDESGLVSHAVVVQEDISEQLQFEEQYRKTQKQEALATLIGGIAHDFNNLLSGMLGHLYLANREVQEMPKTVERLKKIQAVANDIATTVQQLMTFARKGEVDKRKFPLDSFVKEFSKFVEHTVPKNIRLTIDFERAHFSCQGDAEGLQESLLNIVQNAVDAAVDERDSQIQLRLKVFDAEKEGGWVKMHPSLAQGEYAQITVWDNGSGISKDNLERIFDPFFTTKHLGSGLGLAVAIGNVKKNQGIIDVESNKEGSSFHIWLPLLPSKVEYDSAINMNQDIKGKCILLVDDETSVREACGEILELLGYQVQLAEDGRAALEKMQKHGEQIDLIIMDMVMPRMVGAVAAEHIRKIFPKLPIIFATAYDQAVSIKTTREFKHSTLISKPFHPDTLKELIDGFIA